MRAKQSSIALGSFFEVPRRTVVQIARPAPESQDGDATDEALVVRFRNGETAALTKLVRRHERALYNFALRSIRERTAAEDIVQEAFVRVVQNAADFKADARFSTWVYTIVRNLCIDHVRKASHRRHASLDQSRRNQDGDGPTLGELTRDPGSRADVERSVVAGEARTRIASAVHALPDEQREVYLMREVASLRFHEIARITGVPENTVKSRMRYALERLREALGDLEEYARELG